MKVQDCAAGSECTGVCAKSDDAGPIVEDADKHG
jgi:hypothetical protein